MKTKNNRQAMSGLIVVVICIGIVVGVGVVMNEQITSMIDTIMSYNKIKIDEIHISNSRNTSWLTINIKNNGDGKLADLEAVYAGTKADNNSVIDDTDTTTAFTPDELQSGQSGTISVKLGKKISNTTEITFRISATTEDGGKISEVITISPSR